MLVWLWVVQGSYVEAVAQMRGCLQSLGRPLPTTKLDLVSSLFWSVVRQLLHRAALCRVLEWRAVTLRRCSSAADIQLSARDATLVYHKLLQLHLTGSTPTSSSSSTYSPSSTTSCSSSISPVAHTHFLFLLLHLFTLVYHKLLLQLHLTGSTHPLPPALIHPRLPQAAPAPSHR